MDPDTFYRLSEAERRMPCHLHLASSRNGLEGVTYDTPGNAPQCVGRAVFWANKLKEPRTNAILRMARDIVNVFQWPQEFLTHHKNGLLKEDK
jgi:hypothetical protein